MEIAQHLVSLSLQSLGYFVLEGTTAGLREADILAISLNPNGSIRERIHCEVQVSTNPAGVLRPTSRFGKSASFPIESANGFIEKKFFHSELLKVIKLHLRAEPNRRIFVHGRLKDPSQLQAFHDRGIETFAIGALVRKALENDPVRELRRTVEVSELFHITEP